MKLSLGFKSLLFILFVNIGTVQSMGILKIIPALCSPVTDVLSALSPEQKHKKHHPRKLEKNKQDFEQALNTLKDDVLPKTDTSFVKKNHTIHLNIMSLLCWQEYDHSFFSHHLTPPVASAHVNPTNFLLFCYYQKYHTTYGKEEMSDFLFKKDYLKNLFNKCKEARIDGFSALGTAIAAKDISIESKRTFIQELINNGFELTEKDIMLAASELYSEMPEFNVINLLLGQGNLAILPQDVRNCIVQSMIDIFKPLAWLLFNIHPKHAVSTLLCP